MTEFDYVVGCYSTGVSQGRQDYQKHCQWTLYFGGTTISYVYHFTLSSLEDSIYTTLAFDYPAPQKKYNCYGNSSAFYCSVSGYRHSSFFIFFLAS